MLFRSHWLPDDLRAHFESSPRLEQIADVPGSQNKTGRNSEFVRSWRDIDLDDLRLAPDVIDVGSEDGRWAFYSKGGRYGPWWGNWQYVVDWSADAREFYADNRTSNLLGERWRFRQGLCYTDFGGRTFNARWMPPGCLFDMAGPAIFPDVNDGELEEDIGMLLAILNSSPVRELLNALNPSLHYQVSDLRALPIPEVSEDLRAELADRAWTLVDGYRHLARFVESSPRSLDLPDQNERQRAVAFLKRRPEMERELDKLVCELYRCPGLLVDQESRPVHDYENRVDWEAVQTGS